jgi:CubicO group peptidase (beta-lactamase class C family)
LIGVTGKQSAYLAQIAVLFIVAIAPQIAAPVVARAQVSASDDAKVSEKVDAYVAAEMRAEKIPGLALAIVRDGRTIKSLGYGLANLELDVPVKPETIFQTGSVGKQFTATAVMMLVDGGKIHLDDPIRKYLPGSPATWKNITVRNLLTHTSGIHDYETESLKKKGTAFINLRNDYTEDELFRKFSGLPLDFPPGSKWNYSNSGYVILGILIHKVTGQFYGDVLQERIFRPLGMTSTRIISEDDIIPNRAAGYRLVNGEIKNQEWVSPTLNTAADGALYTDVVDMAKWDAALYTEKLLKKGSLNQMWTPVRLNDGKTAGYGFGWDVTSVNGHRLIEHGGAWQGFTTQISRYVDDKFTVIVLTNLDSEHSDPDKIAHKVAAIYNPALTPVPTKEH